MAYVHTQRSSDPTHTQAAQMHPSSSGGHRRHCTQRTVVATSETAHLARPFQYENSTFWPHAMRCPFCMARRLQVSRVVGLAGLNRHTGGPSPLRVLLRVPAMFRPNCQAAIWALLSLCSTCHQRAHAGRLCSACLGVVCCAEPLGWLSNSPVVAWVPPADSHIRTPMSTGTCTCTCTCKYADLLHYSTCAAR